MTFEELVALLSGSGNAYAAPPPQFGGLLGQAQQALQNREQGLLGQVDGTAPQQQKPAAAPQPQAPAAPPAPAPTAIRPNFQTLYPPEQWTLAEHQAFATAHGISKPSVWQAILQSLGVGSAPKK